MNYRNALRLPCPEARDGAPTGADSDLHKAASAKLEPAYSVEFDRVGVQGDASTPACTAGHARRVTGHVGQGHRVLEIGDLLTQSVKPSFTAPSNRRAPWRERGKNTALPVGSVLFLTKEKRDAEYQRRRPEESHCCKGDG